jgi:hypothetical protein
MPPSSKTTSFQIARLGLFRFAGDNSCRYTTTHNIEEGGSTSLSTVVYIYSEIENFAMSQRWGLVK